MLENIILGLLLYKKLSIYEIKKAMDQYVCFFYSSSYGSIIPTLKKMEKNQYVVSNQMVANGRNRKEYELTEVGRNKFIVWLSEEISIGKTENEALLRLFFLSEIPVNERISILNAYIEKLQKTVNELKAIENETLKMNVPKQLEEVFNYRIATIDFGIKYYEFEMDWFRNIINKIINKEI
jgi:DNA-binding PadR family transcriptional regulator